MPACWLVSFRGGDNPFPCVLAYPRHLCASPVLSTCGPTGLLLFVYLRCACCSHCSRVRHRDRLREHTEGKQDEILLYLVELLGRCAIFHQGTSFCSSQPRNLSPVTNVTQRCCICDFIRCFSTSRATTFFPSLSTQNQAGSCESAISMPDDCHAVLLPPADKLIGLFKALQLQNRNAGCFQDRFIQGVTFIIITIRGVAHGLGVIDIFDCIFHALAACYCITYFLCICKQSRFSSSVSTTLLPSESVVSAVLNTT